MAPRRRTPLLVFVIMPFLLNSCQGSGPDLPLDYPDAARSDHTDDYFGTVVADPYRWMEDLEDPAVGTWVAAQNDIAVPFLEGLPGHGEIQDRLTELWNYERFGVPFKEGGLYFFSRNDGLQDQDVVYVAESLDAEPRVLIDPNQVEHHPWVLDRSTSW